MQAAQEALAERGRSKRRVGGGVVKATVTGDGDAARDLDRPERRRSRRRRDARRPRASRRSPRRRARRRSCSRRSSARSTGGTRPRRLLGGGSADCSAEPRVALYEGPVQALIDELGRLPGVGPKSAQRIAFYLLKVDARGRQAGSPARSSTPRNASSWCRRCFNIAEGELCAFCRDERRDAHVALRRRGAARHRRGRAHRRVPRSLPRAAGRDLADRRHRSRAAARQGAARAHRRRGRRPRSSSRPTRTSRAKRPRCTSRGC